jgi:hypothetical protein
MRHGTAIATTAENKEPAATSVHPSAVKDVTKPAVKAA